MADQSFETDIPARLDRLPWHRFHWLVITALGVTWILDGLEVTLVGSLSGAFIGAGGLSMSESQVGLAASAYLAGAIVGAIGFGQLTDLYGRKRLFSITVMVYAVATIATGFAWNFAPFALFRFCTGAGIGGEYAAINSAIDEMIPARARGWTDLAINGTFWIGAALGAGASVILLDPRLLPAWLGWRLAFGIGGALGFGVMVLRRYVPESPRWLMTHVGSPTQKASCVESRAASASISAHCRARPANQSASCRAGRYGLSSSASCCCAAIRDAPFSA